MLRRFLRTGTRKSSRSIISRNVNGNKDLINELAKAASLYVHPGLRPTIPHRTTSPFYCDNVDNKRMERCLRQELKRQLGAFGVNSIKTIYFGGGTPSLCDVATIENLISDVYRICDIEGDIEISLEANPSVEDMSKLRSFRAAGINRVSIGVQALDDEDLVNLGRDHTVRDAIEYVEEADRVFGGRISIDLMFGRPKQTLQSWENELRLALELADSHISLYQLTMERSTPMEKMHRRGEIVLPDKDVIADMYVHSVQHIENSGLKRYEVANFAKKGFESKHNMAYWGGHQYMGIGPGAHGRIHRNDNGLLQRYATVQTLVPEKWMTKIEEGYSGMQKMEKLEKLQTLEELLLQGLTSKDGVEQEVFSAFSDDTQLQDLLNFHTVVDLIKGDFLILDSRGLRATDTGLGVLDSFLPDICLALEDLVIQRHT
eukprot:gene9189-16863_t